MAEPDKQYNGSHVKVHTHCAKHHARTDSDVVCSHPGTAGLLELQGYWNCRAVGTAGLLELRQYWNCRAIGTCIITMINHARTECGCQLSQSDSNGTHTHTNFNVVSAFLWPSCVLNSHDYCMTCSQPLQCEPRCAACLWGARCRAGGGRQEKGPQGVLHMGQVSSCFKVVCSSVADLALGFLSILGTWCLAYLTLGA